jgi:hypothetical protein
MFETIWYRGMTSNREYLILGLFSPLQGLHVESHIHIIPQPMRPKTYYDDNVYTGSILSRRTAKLGKYTSNIRWISTGEGNA